MPHVFVNGISAKSAGGESVLSNFLSVVARAHHDHRFSVVVPHEGNYARFECDRIRIVPKPYLSRPMLLPAASFVALPKLAIELGCDVVLNLADVPLRTDLPQVFLFDWPYAAYPESVAWARARWWDRLKRNLKLWSFVRGLKYLDQVVAQGPAIAERLRNLYEIKAICVIPNAVSVENVGASVEHDFRLPEGFKLLCLSRYYSHKNLEVLVDVAARIKSIDRDWKIIVTIDPDQGPSARRLLSSIRQRRVESVMVNVGSVPMNLVPSLYRQTDGLILPTLLESFSGTYVEAMFHGKPIFTSDLEFARDVCKDCAVYFDPLNPDDIVRTLESALDQVGCVAGKVGRGYARLSEFPSWDGACAEYLRVIDELLVLKSRQP